MAKKHVVAATSEIPPGGRKLVTADGRAIVVFNLGGEFFALSNRCPHRGGPLSEGIVHGASVTCPLHNWVIDLASGKALGADEGCVAAIPVKVEAGRLYLGLAALSSLAA